MENKPMPLRSIARVGILIVLLHFLVSLVHSAAHLNLHIMMNGWQSVYIMLVIFLLPLVAAVFLRKPSRIGFWLLFGSMLGSLVFGGYYHFIALGADNVASLGPHTWTPAFQVSAVLLALTEAVGAVIGALGLRKGQQELP